MSQGRITFTSIISDERYTGFVLKEKNGRFKIGRTAGRTMWGRFQNMICGYWWDEDTMSHIELGKECS